MPKWTIGLVVAILVAAGLRLSAVTASDVLNRMEDKERFGYVSGIVDALIFIEESKTKAPTPRSVCITKWFYGEDGKPGDGSREVISMFGRYPDLSAVGLISVLADRHCGARESAAVPAPR